MRTFFISTISPTHSTEASDYRIDPAIYADQMRVRWTYAQISHAQSEYILHWNLDKESRIGMTGGLQRDQQTVSFGRNPIEDTVEFIMWHRGFVPSTHQLFLFNVELEIIELKPETTEDELHAFLE